MITLRMRAIRNAQRGGGRRLVDRGRGVRGIHEMLENDAIIHGSRYRGRVPHYRYGVAGYEYERIADGQLKMALDNV